METKEELHKQLKRLEQENKELKENLLDKYSPRYYGIVPKRQTVELYKKFDDLRKQNNSYRSALEEIRMYINKCMNSLCDNNCEYWDNCKGNYNINNILTRINEVLNESKQN